MSIIAIIASYIAVVMLRAGGDPRTKKAIADIGKLSIALDKYRLRFREYPPDTGYGLRMDGSRPRYLKRVRGVNVLVATYDPGGLWRYLLKEVRDPRTGEMVGPFLEDWNPGQLKRYDDDYDPPGAESYYLSDPWGNPYGFVGTRKRIVHNPATFDLFSAGRDGVTACNNDKDDNLVGEKKGDGLTDCSDDPQSRLPYDNRAYNANPGDNTEIDDDENDIANDSAEFGPEGTRNGDIGDDISNWSVR